MINPYEYIENNLSESFISDISDNQNNITLNDQGSVIASMPELDNNENEKLISIKAIYPTWIQLRNQENETKTQGN